MNKPDLSHWLFKDLPPKKKKEKPAPVCPKCGSTDIMEMVLEDPLTGKIVEHYGVCRDCLTRVPLNEESDSTNPKIVDIYVNEFTRIYNDYDEAARQFREYGEWYERVPEKAVPINEILLRDVWNRMRYEDNYKKIKATGKTKPVRLSYHEEDGKFHISDGIHRINAAKDLGYTHIPAFVSYRRTEAPTKTGLVKIEYPIQEKAVSGVEINWDHNVVVVTDKSLLSVPRWTEENEDNPDYLPVEKAIMNKAVEIINKRTGEEISYADFVSGISWSFAWHVKGEPEYISDVLYQVNREIQDYLTAES